ncbi:MAG: ABC transporter substrate-binding protein [Spirochaetaceae bacterium]
MEQHRTKTCFPNVTATRQMFDSLVFRNDGAQIELAPARDWEVSDDGREYTFYLREDVNSHNGEPFKSTIPIPEPHIERTRSRVILQGEFPSPSDPPSGCVFHTRCSFATGRN